MPCDRVRTTTLELTCADQDLLKKALESLGATVNVSPTGELYGYIKDGTRYNVRSGKITVDQRSMGFVDQLKQAYSTQAVKAAAQKFGWQVRTKAANRLQVVKRAF